MTTMLQPGAFGKAKREEWLQRASRGAAAGAAGSPPAPETVQGIPVEILYGQAHGPGISRRRHGPWRVFQRADHPDPGLANAQALEDLEHGAGGLALCLAGGSSARGSGLDKGNLANVLHGVHLHAIAIRLEGEGARELAALIASLPLDPQRLDVSFGLGRPELVADLADMGFTGPFLEADGRPWHELGASDAEELGAVLATALGHLRAMDELGLALGPDAVGMTLAATQDMFMTMAKFRAMRLLWRRVLEASGLADSPLRLHGETGWRMMATSDPHSNILRTAAAAFGAGLGGADSICVLPFAQRQGLPNGFARRIARNQQNILLEEASLWRVDDPASGSGYVQALTTSLCEAAWGVMQRTERGEWPRPSPEAAAGRPVIGTTVYRLPAEVAPEVETLP